MSVKPQAQTLEFQAEVAQLLQLVAHSLYSNKEIFLRELISNASDAADKLRFEALNDDALYENDHELKAWVDFDAEAKTITIRDNGVGMSREEVIANIGTIAKSGTQEFLKHLTGDQAKDAKLIGQFGVGFYSAFVVADRVIVKTRRAGMTADQGVYWESDGSGKFTIQNMDKSNRGTEIILHLKPDDEEFLDNWRLRSIITKYSDHIILPVVMKKEEVPSAEEEKVETEEEKAKAEGEAAKEPEQKQPEEEVVNRAQALWTVSKSEIKDEEYNELYKHIAHDFDDPLIWAHNRVEGKLEYISLLFIPKHAPFDMWNRERPRGLKLYVQRVFIMDEAEQLLPMYLRFVKGIVDSNDLPLNISREILQSSKVIDSIRGGVVRRILDMLENLATEDSDKYAEFWKAFGQVIKEGPGEDYANKDRIAKLLRFASTHNDSDQQSVSLADYVGRMKEGHDKIYYLIADSYAAAKNSPHLEIFKKKGIEVLLLSDRVDEWLSAHLNEFEGKQLMSITKGNVDLGGLEDEQEKEQQEKLEKDFESVLKQVQEVLGDNVKEVRVTRRLTDSPACVVVDDDEMSSHLQRLLQEAGQDAPLSKPILEVNPTHPLISRLKNEQSEDRFAEWTHIIFDQALLAEGAKLNDPATFVKRLNTLLMELST